MSPMPLGEIEFALQKTLLIDLPAKVAGGNWENDHPVMLTIAHCYTVVRTVLLKPPGDKSKILDKLLDISTMLDHDAFPLK